MLSIDTSDFLLQIRPVAMRREEPGGPYLEWLDVWVRIEVPGIQAEGAWSVMPDELRGFLQQLQTMHAQLRPDQRAELASVEAGFALSLQTLERGVITGDWRFQPSPPDGACLTGHCGLDQTYLHQWMQGIESLLAFVPSNNSP